MGSTSLTATCGTIVVALLVVWGINWYCTKETPTGNFVVETCAAAKPFYSLAGRVARWFAGLFDDKPAASQKPGLQQQGCAPVPDPVAPAIFAADPAFQLRNPYL